MRVYAPTAFRTGGRDYPQGWQDMPQSLADTLVASGLLVADLPDAALNGPAANAKVQWGAHANRPVASPTYSGVLWVSQDRDGGQAYYCDGVSWLDLAAFVNAGIEGVVDVASSRTIVSTDNRCMLRITAVAPVTLTLPAGLPSQFRCRVMQQNSGAKTTMAASGGASVNGQGGKLSTNGQYTVIEILPTGTADAYVVGGQSSV